MPQDAFTLKYLASELSEVLVGGKVNRIVAENSDRIIFTIFTGKDTKNLLISVNPASPRMGLTTNQINAPLTASNFCMLLRKHLLSSTIKEISLVGFDRIIKIDFLLGGEFSDGEIRTLFIELMGRYSNVILTENGNVLGCNRGINMFDNGVRPLICKKPYVFPPDNGKMLPFSDQMYEKFGAFIGDDLVGFITENVQGIASLTAKEIVSQFTEKYGEYEKGKSRIFVDFFRNFINTPKAPVVYFDGEKICDVSAFNYSVMKEYKRLEFSWLYQAEDYYYNEKEKLKEFSLLRERLTSIICANVKKLKKKISLINAKISEAEKLEQNKLYGELLTANLYKYKQNEKTVEVDNYYDGSKVKIVLDEKISVAKNAENFYKKYNKQKRTLIALAPQKEQLLSELNYYENLSDLVAIADDVSFLISVKEEMVFEGLIKVQNQKKNKEKALGCLAYNYNGFNIKVGRSNVENDRLIALANGCDTWLHLKDYHSSHVIIESEGREIPEDVLITACEICAYYSRARESDKVEVVYTLKKHVKKPRGAKPGFVHYTNFKSLLVNPKKHETIKKT